MLKKVAFFIFIIFIFSNCGYSPIYLDNNTNFTITSLEITGNEKANNIIRNRLKKYLNNEVEKKYELKIKTSYQKDSVVKDLTGNATNFMLTTTLSSDFIKLNSNL